jgi:catechol 2,3-dioxygenase-like lactoylglutathione lyase family enzyme
MYADSGATRILAIRYGATVGNTSKENAEMKTQLPSFILPMFLLAIAWAGPRSVRADDVPAMPFEMSKPGLDVGVVVSDMDKAKKFYGDALGLQRLPDLPLVLPDGGKLVRFQCGATVVKLLTYPKAPPKVEHGVMQANGIRLLTMMVKDPDTLAKRLTDQGYTDPKFSAVRPAGYRVGFTEDPDGNQVELLAWGADAPADIYDRFQIGLTVTNIEKMQEFYGKTLGLKLRAPQPLASIGPGGMEYFYIAGETTVKFWQPQSDRPTRSGGIEGALGIRYITFLVKDVDATYTALKARGVNVTTPPTDLGNVARIVLIADPDGNTIEFASIPSNAARGR